MFAARLVHRILNLLDQDIKQVQYYITVYNLGQKGCGLDHVTYILIFKPPLNLRND